MRFLSIIVILLMYYQCGGAGANSNKSCDLSKPYSNLKVKGGDDTLRVMTYNIQCLESFWTWFANVRRREDALCSHLKKLVMELDLEVLILHELFSHRVYNKLKETLKDTLPYNTGISGVRGEVRKWDTYYSRRFCDCFSIFNGGNCIFSKYPIVEKHQLIYKRIMSYSAFARKGAALAVIKKGEHLYNVIGSHMQSFDNQGHHEVRIKEMKEIDEWLQLLYKKDRQLSKYNEYNIKSDDPIILAGDLNTDLYKRLGGDLVRLFGGSTMKTRFYDTFDSKGSDATYSTKTNDFCKLQNDEDTEQLLDYIMTSEKLDVLVSQKTIMMKLTTPVTVKKYRCLWFPAGSHQITNISDHHPVFAMVTVKNRPENSKNICKW